MHMHHLYMYMYKREALLISDISQTDKTSANLSLSGANLSLSGANLSLSGAILSLDICPMRLLPKYLHADKTSMNLSVILF